MSKSGDDEDGTCPICQDGYRDPRTLPCSHTFCRRCLTGHVLASERHHRATAASAHSFLCPLCNSVTAPPDPLQHRFFWARQFPTNDKLQQNAAFRLAPAGGGAGAERAESGVGAGGATCLSHPAAKAETWCTDHDVAVCWECAISTHKPCSGILKLPQAAIRRKQEVDDMRTRLDALRDSFEKELEHLDNLDSRMAAERRATLADVEDFHTRATALLAEKREELLARVEESYESRVDGAERKRGAWRGMVEEIDETSTVAEMVFMQASELEVLAQFAPLKQQFDNLQYMLPALGTQLQSYRWALRDPDTCIQDLRSLTVEEIQSEGSLAPGSGVTARGGPQRETSPLMTPAPDYQPSSSSSSSSMPASSHATRDRRSHTLHKIRRRRQRVTPSSFARVDKSTTGSQGQGQGQKVRKDGEVKAVQILELCAAMDSDADSYGLGDVCLLHPRGVLLAAYLNSPSLRVFFLPPLPVRQGQAKLPPVSGSSSSSSKGVSTSEGSSNSGGAGGKNATVLSITKNGAAVLTDKHGGVPGKPTTTTTASSSGNSSDSAGISNLSLKPSVCELTHSPCCLAQLASDLVVATSSNSSQLSIIRVSASSARAWRRVEVGKQYRAVARAGGPQASSSSSRCVALATYHSGEAAENVIDFVQFDEEFKTFALLRTVSSHGSGVSGSVGHAPSHPGHAPASQGHASSTSDRASAGPGHVSSSAGRHPPAHSILSSAPDHALASPAPLFRAPHSLWVGRGGELVMSDGDTPAIVGIGRSGDLSFRFQPDDEEMLDSPAGVVGTANGEIYVADACTQCVLRLSPTGRHLGFVLGPESSLQSPVALALSANGILYVADFYGSIRVFSISV